MTKKLTAYQIAYSLVQERMNIDPACKKPKKKSTMKEPIHVITITTYDAEDREFTKPLVEEKALVESSSQLGATATWVAETLISNKMKAIFGEESDEQ